ncbi:hypothetical protein [Mesorhizobium sp. M6A.T.Ce.TU.016.01.1.1]|uniref:hypothetical protein n=1 Tax=Mesorhizobium sp. M6A.T.Ce.TU.016.01.1.1 TaxID=2496783 RepID=UPI000FCBA215|nr:hypothetical protein [Mesorhizobium sp. M6A.T.Ce.TU.016.01.1.1]RUU29773.1 hypothetical protein EOC94_12970 [Mesorhizobium sp. M6A.T.Ce.TU.016.01.1.1]
MTNNLGRTLVATGQADNGVVAINDSDGALDAKLTAFLTIAVDSTSESLTAAQIRGYAGFILTDSTPGGAVTLTLPANSVGRFGVVNSCGQTVTVTISGQSVTAPTIADGKSDTLISDGVNVRYASSYAVRSSDASRIVEISQIAYDALSPADADTVYLITS